MLGLLRLGGEGGAGERAYIVDGHGLGIAILDVGDAVVEDLCHRRSAHGLGTE